MAAVTVKQLANSGLDTVTFGQVTMADGFTADQTTNRDGVTIDTLEGRLKKLGYEAPIPYAASIVFAAEDRIKTVEEVGVVYAPLPSALPFTTSGTFIGDDDARFFPIQTDNTSLVTLSGLPSGSTERGIGFSIIRDSATDQEAFSDLDASDIVQFSTVAALKAGTCINGNTVDFVALADRGGRAETTGYYDGWATESIPNGSASYQFATFAEVRNAKSDQSWVPDELGDFTVDTNIAAMLLNDGAVNVRQYGAVGDGITNDQLSCQAATNSLTGFGGSVKFPKGTYLVTSLNPYSTGITGNKYPSTVAGGQLNMVRFIGDGYTLSTIKSTTGDAIRPIDPELPQATPGRLTIWMEDLSIVGDDTNNDAVKTGRGFFADTTEVSLSYIYIKGCLISYFHEGFNYLGYEGAGPLADGHTIFENCIIANNQKGSVTAVDNVTYLNCYISRNTEYGIWIREGRAIELIGGKIQLNGQDNFGVGDVFAQSGQVLIGGTTTRDDNIGNITFRGVYLEPTFDSGNGTKFSFIDVRQEDTTARTMLVSSIKFDDIFVNGKDAENFIRLADNCDLSNLMIDNSQLEGFNLPGNRLVNLGSSSRVSRGELGLNNSLAVKNDSDLDIPSDLVRLLEPKSSNQLFNYNIANQSGFKAAQTIGSAISNGSFITTAVIVGSQRSVYRITVDDVFISGGDELISVPYIGLFVVTPDATKQEDILNTGYAFSVDGGSGALVITNNSGGAREFSYIIEKLL